ncbi:MAG: bifunctional 4-hydroxy-3-methylbut-2-enyl diphosphate reductase/30S ribosomal protein S1 [Oscillospiraceae bacterium]|nr:bifunctional 4-hydroxy-3-methylbut-2-enyl diphosphate reductase/30S ribosomal protein S1 [Oscillospiraceae bacterium]
MTGPEIILAKSAGFCFGVRRAVEMARAQAEKGGRVCTLGQLIHNNDVTERLRSLGVETVESPADAPEGAAVIIRSHGVPDRVYKELEALQLQAVDATCPMVKRVRTLLDRERDRGRRIVIVGEPDHPEVEAMTDGRPGVLVVRSPQEAEKLFSEGKLGAHEAVSLLSQTTCRRENFENVIKIIKKQCTNCEIFDTICEATSERQREAAVLAAQCDAFVVIGGRHSANSRNLAALAAEACPKVLFIENGDELDTAELRGKSRIGVTAGASTPEWIIKEVIRKMSDEIKSVNGTENTEAAEASFEEMLERSIKTLHTGEKVSGIIASITPTEVSVDLGTKQSGYIPISELTDEPNANVAELFKVGDEIEAFVTRVNDVEGTVMLSKKRLDANKAWDTITEARNERAIVEGTVVEENKGGVIVMVKGVRVFVPASQSGLPKDASMAELLKQKVKLRIREVNQPRRRVVGSIRDVQYEERRAKAQKIWEEIEVGKHYNGVVKSLTSYGAFVDIGGVDGMVHVSELSWSRIHQPSEVVSVGDELDVYVISFDKETRKISLGHRDPNQNPWKVFTDKYSVGDIAEVKIVKLMTFGAFAEIVPGVDGLIHISQIANRRIGKPEEVLSEGQTVEAKITAIDEENKKVSLSIRAAAEAEAPKAPEAEEGAEQVVYDTENPPADAE